MAYLLIRHKVRNYPKWKRGYDAHSRVRRKAGLREKNLARNIRNPRDVFILFQASDLRKAKGFASSRDLRKTMKRLGVLGRPEIWFLR